MRWNSTTRWTWICLSFSIVRFLYGFLMSNLACIQALWDQVASINRGEGLVQKKCLEYETFLRIEKNIIEMKLSVNKAVDNCRRVSKPDAWNVHVRDYHWWTDTTRMCVGIQLINSSFNENERENEMTCPRGFFRTDGHLLLSVSSF